MTPPQMDGTSGDYDPSEDRQRAWGRTLARIVMFGGLFMVSGVLFCAVYAAVWAFRRG